MASYDLVKHQERTGHEEVYGKYIQASPAVELNKELERIYSAAQQEWNFKGERMSAYLHNAQYTQEQADKLARRKMAPVPINVIYPAVEQAISLITHNRPSFQATAKEDSDVKTAKVITDLLTDIWDSNNAQMHLKEAIYDYYVKGRGVLFAYYDPNKNYGKGGVVITSLDPFYVYPDPNSKDRLWRDAAHIIVSRIMTREQIESMWPTVALQMGQVGHTEVDHAYSDEMVRAEGQQIGPMGSTTDGYHDKYKVIDRYTKVLVHYTHLKDSTNGEENIFLPEEWQEFLQMPAMHVFIEGQGDQYFTEPSVVMELMQLYDSLPEGGREDDSRINIPEPVQGPDGQMIQPPPQVLTPITMPELLDLGILESKPLQLRRIQLVISIGDIEFYNGYLPTEEYPVIPFNNRFDRHPYPMGDVEFVKPMQDVINNLHSKIIANLSSGNNQKLIVPRGSIDKETIEQELGKAGTAVIEVDYDLGQPVIMGPQQIPNGLFVYLDQLKADVEKELGIFALMAGDPQAAPQTHKGTLALDEFGQRRIKSKLDDIENSIIQLGRVTLDLVQYFYTEERVIRLVKANNVVRESIANQLIYDDTTGVPERMNDITLGTFDVKIVAGSTLPSNRWALEEYYNELFTIGVIDQVERLKKSEVVDAEGVLERFGYITQLEQMVAQLQEEIKDLRGDLQTAERAEVNSRKRVEVEKFKSDLTTGKAQAQAATKLYEARLNDELKLMRQKNAASDNSRS